MKLRLLLLLMLSCAFAGAQTTAPATPAKPTKPKREFDMPDPVPYAAGIRAADLKSLVDVLASDSLEGRETGEAGQRKAADFIAQQFKALGLPTEGDRNTYFQTIRLQRETWKEIKLKIYLRKN